MLCFALLCQIRFFDWASMLTDRADVVSVPARQDASSMAYFVGVFGKKGFNVSTANPRGQDVEFQLTYVRCCCCRSLIFFLL